MEMISFSQQMTKQLRKLRHRAESLGTLPKITRLASGKAKARAPRQAPGPVPLNSVPSARQPGLSENETGAEEANQRKLLCGPQPPAHRTRENEAIGFIHQLLQKHWLSVFQIPPSPWQKTLSKPICLSSTVVHSTPQEYVHSLSW